jgi:hypothetical protein
MCKVKAKALKMRNLLGALMSDKTNK